MLRARQMCRVGLLEWTDRRAGYRAWLHVRPGNLCERCIRSNCGKVRDVTSSRALGRWLTFDCSISSAFKTTNFFLFHSAFKTSDYPVILSFENHCNPRQQVSRVVSAFLPSLPSERLKASITLTSLWFDEIKVSAHVACNTQFAIKSLNPLGALHFFIRSLLMKMWNFSTTRGSLTCY